VDGLVWAIVGLIPPFASAATGIYEELQTIEINIQNITVGALQSPLSDLLNLSTKIFFINELVAPIGEGFGAEPVAKWLYGELGRDGLYNSSFIERLNNDFQGGEGIRWYSYGGQTILPFTADIPAGHLIDALLCGELLASGILVVLGVPPVTPLNVFRLVCAANILVDVAIAEWWCSNTDDRVLGVRTTWTDLNSISPNYHAEYAIWKGIPHCDMRKEWDKILDAIEDPPEIHWDKIVYVDGKEILISDDNSDKISINLAKKQPDSLIGRIDDYFLASCTTYVSINFHPWQKLIWGEDVGIDGNNFVLRGLNNQNVIFPGWNQIDIKAKNIEGEWSRQRTLRIKWNPFDTYITFIKPQSEASFSSANSPLACTLSVDFVDNMSGISAESLRIIGPADTVIYVEGFSFTDFNAEDTLTHILYIPQDEGEGAYKTEALCVNGDNNTTKNIERFFIDNTPPEVVINLPLSEDSVVYSSRVSGQMPIVFNITDNFDTLMSQPKDGKVYITIRSVSNYLILADTVENYCYGLPKRVYWDFKDNDGNVVLESGKYEIYVVVQDKAGNEDGDTTYFYLDNEPPQITVISPFDSLFTSNQDFLELKYLTDEDAELTLKWINTINNDTITRRMARGYYDMDEDGVQDTNRYYEGSTAYGEYIPDGIYTVEFIPKDVAGNKDTITTGVISGDTLRIDRTKPLLTEVAVVPFITNDTTRFKFKVSEANDIPQNRDSVEIRIFTDDNLDTTFKVLPDSGHIQENVKIDISSLNNGVHHIKVEAEDRWGNVAGASRPVVKGTIGTEITSPLDGSTLPKSVIAIRGIANDPDMFNSLPYKGYAIYWRPQGGVWDSINIFVPEYLRNAGTPSYRGDESIENEALLGYWYADTIPGGNYDLLLESYEEGGLTLADTISITIDTTLSVISPSIDNLTLTILNSSDDTFNPTEDETLKIDYELSGKPSNISIDIINSLGENVYHKGVENVMSEGVPSSILPGVNVYRDNGKWWVICYSPSFSIFNVSIKGLDSTLEITDTIGGNITFTDYTINFNSFTADTSDTITGFGFTGSGKIKFDVTVNGDKNSIAYTGEGNAPLQSPFVLQTSFPVKWDGSRFGGGKVRNGDYTLKVSATGLDDIGQDIKSDIIHIRSLFTLTDTLISNEAFPYTEPPLAATVEYRTNLDAYVKVDVYRGTQYILTIQEPESLHAGWKEDASWNGRFPDGSIAQVDSIYRFKITAYTMPDSVDSIVQYSEYFSVKSVPVSQGDFYIPGRYIEGEINAGTDTVYNGKTEFIWDAMAGGEYYPPQPYSFEDTAKGWKKRTIKWKVRVYRRVKWIERNPRATAHSESCDDKVEDGDTIDFVIPYDQYVTYELYSNVDYDICLWPGADREGKASAGIRCGQSTKFEANDNGKIDQNDTSKGSKYCRKGDTVTLWAYTMADGWHGWIGQCCVWADAHAYACYNRGGHVQIDNAQYSGTDTILGNQATSIEIGEFNANPFENVIEPDSVRWTYTLETTIDGVTESNSTHNTTGSLSVTNRGITVKINISNNKVFAYVDTSDTYSKWVQISPEIAKACTTDTSIQYLPDTTFFSDIFTIPTDVDETTVTYSNPVQLSGNYVNLVKGVAPDGEPCIIATVSGWNPDWNTIKDSSNEIPSGILIVISSFESPFI